MKKITLLFVMVLATSFVSNAQISTNPITTGSPINNGTKIYLGDKLVNTYFQFEIGQAAWNASDVGIGQNADGETDWDWDSAAWYADGSAPNKKVQRDLSDFQFTSTGTWYVVGRARANGTDAWTYADDGGWSNNTQFTTTNCPYYSVSALEVPTAQTATAYSANQINLNWTKWAGRDVLVVARKSSDSAADTPVNGTNYAVGDVLGTGTVVYKGGDESYSVTSLDASTKYVFEIYSENWGYYSAAVTATATTLNPEWYEDKITINGTEYDFNSLDGTDLGSITNLVINGADLKYSDSNVDATARTGSAYYYSVQEVGSSTVVTDVEVILNQSDLGNNSYQGVTTTATHNILSSTAIKDKKSYILHIWAKSWNGEAGGDKFLWNGGNNYKVNFTADKVSTDVDKLETSLSLSGANGKVVARFDGTADVKLYSVSGKMLASKKDVSEFTQKLDLGVYLLSINNKVFKVIVR